jgi:hypothetical protein
MLTLLLNGISIALGTVGGLLIALELRLRLDRAFLYFGLVVLSLCGFMLIETAGLPYAGGAKALWWVRVEHLVIVAAVPTFVAYTLAICRTRHPRLVRIWVTAAIFVSLAMLSPWMLARSDQGAPAVTIAYPIVFPPYLTAGACTGLAVLVQGLRGASDLQRRLISLQLVGVLYLCVVGAATTLLTISSDAGGTWSDRVTIGLVVYVAVYCVFTMTTLFARLSALVNERAKALADASTQRDRAEQLLTDFLSVLASAIESRDHYTGGHVVRVARYAEDLARKLGLDAPTVRGISLGAVVHDLGKIGVRDDIVNKTEGLDEIELIAMRAHTRIGSDLLDRIGEFGIARNIALCHHERWDGTGYPSALLGEEIPLEARIVAVADYWDAIVTDRPYRKAMPLQEAVAHMQSERARAFDPRILDLFMDPADPIYLRFVSGNATW